MRQARAASRAEQIRRVKSLPAPASPSEAEIAVFLLEHERLCDTVADDVLRDLGFDETPIRGRLAELHRSLRGVSER